jgi:hypothetical protein
MSFRSIRSNPCLLTRPSTRKNLIPIGLCLFLAVLSFWVSPLRAALSISPNYMDMGITPGKLYKSFFKVVNQGRERVKADIFANDRWVKVMKGSDFVMGNPDWVWFETNTAFLDPSEERIFTCYIQVNEKNATNGEYLEMISVDETGPSPVTGRMSVPMYLGIEGHYHPDIKITGWTNTVASNGTMQFFVSLSNSGNTRLFPKVDLTIQNERKRLIQHWEKDLKSSLGPGKIHRFEFDPFMSSSKVLACELKVDCSKFGVVRKEVLNRTIRMKD